jgi:outer membrane protein TolC
MVSRMLAGGAIFALTVASLSVAPAAAQGSMSAAPLGAPAPLAIPSPIASLPPASQPSTLPYPAYGTPVPGVNRGVPVPDVPQVISVDQAVAIGFARSPLLAQARAVIEIDQAPVDLAKTAVLPNISGVATGTHSYNEVPTSGTKIGGSFVSDGLTATLKQLIFDGGKIAAQLRAAKATENGALATYKRQLQTVAFNVTNAYYAALAAQRTTQVASETLKLNQVNADLVSAQIAAGTTARSELLTAQLPVAQARVALVKDQGLELSAQAAFVNAMGLEANTYVLPKDDGNVLAGTSGTPSVPAPTYDAAIARAYMLRPDFSAQQYAITSTQASLKAAGLGLFPNLSGNASYGTSSTDPHGGTLRNNGSIGLSLSIPIFDQGITHAQVEQARGNLDAAVAALQVLRQGIQLNVKQTLVNLVSANAVFTQTQAELANARQVLQATQAQYAAGVTTLPLLLNAQVGLTQALVDQVNAVYSLRQAEAAFLYAEGANAPA